MTELQYQAKIAKLEKELQVSYRNLHDWFAGMALGNPVIFTPGMSDEAIALKSQRIADHMIRISRRKG